GVAEGASWSYVWSPASASVGAAAGSGSFSVNSAAGCAWNAASNATWLSIAGGSRSSGSGTLYYSFGVNSGATRIGSINVGDQAFSLSQSGGCTYALSPASA